MDSHIDDSPHAPKAGGAGRGGSVNSWSGPTGSWFGPPTFLLAGDAFTLKPTQNAAVVTAGEPSPSLVASNQM